METVFGFKGHVGDRWVMKETLPRATMEPIPEAVERIKDNPDRLQVSHLGSKVMWVTDGTPSCIHGTNTRSGRTHKRQPGQITGKPFGFKGHVGDRWVINKALPHASMEPIPEALERIKDNPDRLRVSHLGSKVMWVTDG